MATPTPNLGLIKPDMPDEVDQTIPALAENFSKIDTAITDNSNGLGALKADVAQRGINIRSVPYLVPNDGTDSYTAMSSLLTAIGSMMTTLVVPYGTYRFSTNIMFPSNASLIFLNGAKFSPDNGVTIKVLGNIIAANQEIFIDNGGTVDLDNSPNEYNLGWFSSGSGCINERWNFAKRGMLTFRTKIIRIPRPYQGQAGSFLSGNRLYWYFSDEIKITDNQNASTWYIDAEFYAKNNCTNFINIEDVAKPENIYFYGVLQAMSPAGTTVNYGINIKGTARLVFYGNVVLNGFQTGLKIGGTDTVASNSDIRFIDLQISFYTVTGINIYGKSGNVAQNIIIDNLSITAAQVTGTNAVELRGLLRDIKLSNVFYATDVAKDGYTANDADNVVYVESNSEGDIFHCSVDAIYQANANNGIKITSTASNAAKIRSFVVRRIYGKFNNGGADIDWCYGTSIEYVENTSNITIGTNALYTKITSNESAKTITDNGAQTLINGLGKQSRGTGVLPAATLDWPIGCLIRETSDGKVYLRFAKTGVAANDFVVLN